MENPFAGRGSPVDGKRLVGRAEVFDKLLSRVISGAHCSIVGLPRIGKTSLARKVVNSIVTTDNLETVSITMDSLRNPSHAYARIIEGLSRDEEQSFEAIGVLSHDSSYEYFLRFLRRKARLGWNAVVLIDEFDAIRRGDFPDGQLFVSRLREIANDRSRYGLTFIFSSRRSLDMIQGAIDCSTLAGLCEVVYLQPLTEDGIKEMASRSLVQVSSCGSESLWEISGGHPFLAEVVLCEVHEKRNQLVNREAVEFAQHKQAHEFTNQYRQLRELLSSDGMFEFLCELTCGPRWRQIDPHVNCLLKHYGLVVSIKNQIGLRAMSEHFQEFLRMHSRQTPTWFILGEVERQLRAIIEDRYCEKYGVNWLKNLNEKYPKTNEAIEKFESQRRRESKVFGDAASEAILDYAYIGDLKDLIFIEWDSFREMFGGGKSDWERRFQAITKVRNPMAHHRQVPSDVIHDAEISCKILLEKMRSGYSTSEEEERPTSGSSGN